MMPEIPNNSFTKKLYSTYLSYLPKEKVTMDRNDLLKSKKVAIDDMAELAKSGEDVERMETLKNEIRSLDSRLEALDIADAAKKESKR